jgi:transcriptional regulator with XRE-family HTH domain
MTARSQIHPVDLRIGECLRQQRRRAGWSQEALARAIGVSFQQIQKYKRGLNRLTSSKLHAVAKTLKIDIDDLFEGLPPPVQPTATPAIASLLADEDGATIAFDLARLRPLERKKTLEILKILGLRNDE